MRLCVIGDPVGHSLSPLLHRRMLDRAGLTGSYETVTVTPDTLPEFLAAARAGAWDGCNVTMPDKTAGASYLDALSPAAKLIGVCNTVTVGEDGPVVTAGLQKRVTFRPKGEDETVAAAELIAKAFCPPEAPMPTDALKARIDAFLEAHNTLALATGCGKWVRCTPLEYLRVDGRLYILTEGGLKFKGIWWNGAISAAVFDSYAGMASLAGLQMTGTAVYIDPLSDEYRSVIEARGVQLQQLQQMPAMLHAVRLDITRYELLDGALRADGYAARQVLDLG